MKRHILVFIIIVVGLSAYTSLTAEPVAPTIDDLKPVTYPETVIGRIGEGYFNFEIADTQKEKTTGLSGREQLPDTDAMLFTFVAPGENCFWMKDMKFAIDMLWFDSSKILVSEKRSVSPSTYPEQTFCPDVPSQYVVEVTAGVAEKNGIKLGDKLELEL